MSTKYKIVGKRQQFDIWELIKVPAGFLFQISRWGGGMILPPLRGGHNKSRMQTVQTADDSEVQTADQCANVYSCTAWPKVLISLELEESTGPAGAFFSIS